MKKYNPKIIIPVIIFIILAISLILFFVLFIYLPQFHSDQRVGQLKSLLENENYSELEIENFSENEQYNLLGNISVDEIQSAMSEASFPNTGLYNLKLDKFYIQLNIIDYPEGDDLKLTGGLNAPNLYQNIYTEHILAHTALIYDLEEKILVIYDIDNSKILFEKVDFEMGIIQEELKDENIYGKLYKDFGFTDIEDKFDNSEYGFFSFENLNKIYKLRDYNLDNVIDLSITKDIISTDFSKNTIYLISEDGVYLQEEYPLATWQNDTRFFMRIKDEANRDLFQQSLSASDTISEDEKIVFYQSYLKGTELIDYQEIVFNAKDGNLERLSQDFGEGFVEIEQPYEYEMDFRDPGVSAYIEPRKAIHYTFQAGQDTLPILNISSTFTTYIINENLRGSIAPLPSGRGLVYFEKVEGLNPNLIVLDLDNGSSNTQRNSIPLPNGDKFIDKILAFDFISNDEVLFELNDETFVLLNVRGGVSVFNYDPSPRIVERFRDLNGRGYRSSNFYNFDEAIKANTIEAQTLSQEEFDERFLREDENMLDNEESTELDFLDFENIGIGIEMPYSHSVVCSDSNLQDYECLEDSAVTININEDAEGVVKGDMFFVVNRTEELLSMDTESLVNNIAKNKNNFKQFSYDRTIINDEEWIFVERQNDVFGEKAAYVHILVEEDRIIYIRTKVSFTSETEPFLDIIETIDAN